MRQGQSAPAARRQPSEGVMNSLEVMNSLLAQTPKKGEGKKRRSPQTPYREKGKGKENRRGFLRKPSFACARSRVRASIDADLDLAVQAFGGTASDRAIWASIAWRVGAEQFHYAVLDKIGEDAADGAPRKAAATFQAFLNARFPKPEGGAA